MLKKKFLFFIFFIKNNFLFTDNLSKIFIDDKNNLSLNNKNILSQNKNDSLVHYDIVNKNKLEKPKKKLNRKKQLKKLKKIKKRSKNINNKNLKQYLKSLNIFLLKIKQYLKSLNIFLLKIKQYLKSLNIFLLKIKQYLNNKIHKQKIKKFFKFIKKTISIKLIGIITIISYFLFLILKKKNNNNNLTKKYTTFNQNDLNNLLKKEENLNNIDEDIIIFNQKDQMIEYNPITLQTNNINNKSLRELMSPNLINTIKTYEDNLIKYILSDTNIITQKNLIDDQNYLSTFKEVFEKVLDQKIQDANCKYNFINKNPKKYLSSIRLNDNDVFIHFDIDYIQEKLLIKCINLEKSKLPELNTIYIMNINLNIQQQKELNAIKILYKDYLNHDNYNIADNKMLDFIINKFNTQIDSKNHHNKLIENIAQKKVANYFDDMYSFYSLKFLNEPINLIIIKKNIDKLYNSIFIFTDENNKIIITVMLETKNDTEHKISSVLYKKKNSLIDDISEIVNPSNSSTNQILTVAQILKQFNINIKYNNFSCENYLECYFKNINKRIIDYLQSLKSNYMQSFIKKNNDIFNFDDSLTLEKQQERNYQIIKKILRNSELLILQKIEKNQKSYLHELNRLQKELNMFNENLIRNQYMNLRNPEKNILHTQPQLENYITNRKKEIEFILKNNQKDLIDYQKNILTFLFNFMSSLINLEINMSKHLTFIFQYEENVTHIKEKKENVTHIKEQDDLSNIDFEIKNILKNFHDLETTYNTFDKHMNKLIIMYNDLYTQNKEKKTKIPKDDDNDNNIITVLKHVVIDELKQSLKITEDIVNCFFADDYS
jgi:hypothetical protein